jgi:micrococcal nuclease
MYTYEAVLMRVIDGDTEDLRIDLGFNVFTEQRFRLLGINTPELHSKDADEKVRAKAAMNYLSGLLSSSPLTARTSKDKQEKYGRYLATIINNAGLDVNEEMVKAGHAKRYDGGKRE